MIVSTRRCEHVGQRLRRRPDGAPRIVRRHGHLEQQLAEGVGACPRHRPRSSASGGHHRQRPPGTPRRPVDRGRSEHDRPGPRRHVAEIVEGLRHRPRQDDRHLRPADRHRRDERGQLADRAAFVGARRVGGADEDGVDVVIEQEPRHHERIRGLGARSGGPPAAATGGRHEPRQRPLGTRHDRQPPGPPAADLEARQGIAADVGHAERRRELRVRGPDAADEQLDGDVHGGPGREREAADEAPRARDPADQRDRSGGGAMVDGQEGMRIGGHRQMLPGPPGTRVVRRPRRALRRAPRAVRSAARCRSRRP